MKMNETSTMNTMSRSDEFFVSQNQDQNLRQNHATYRKLLPSVGWFDRPSFEKSQQVTEGIFAELIDELFRS